MESLQVLSRMFFRAFVVSMLFLMHDPKAIYGLPFGILVALCSEASYLTRKKDEPKNKNIPGSKL